MRFTSSADVFAEDQLPGFFTAFVVWLNKTGNRSMEFPAVYTTSFVFCALGRSLTNFFQQPSAPRHSRHFNIFQSQKLNINFPLNQLYNFSSFNSGGWMLIETIFPGYCCSFFSNLLEKIWITGEEIPSWSLLGVRTLLKGVLILPAT